MKLFDFIITLFNTGKADFIDRYRNLLLALESIPNNVNVILIEQKNKDLPMYLDYIKSTYSGDNNLVYVVKDNIESDIFYKSYLYNVAIKNYSVTDCIILGEADIVYNPLHFNKFYQFIIDNTNIYRHWCMCWDFTIYMNKWATKKYLQDTSPAFEIGCAGMGVYFNKNFYWNMGGANELVLGAAAIDNDIAMRAAYFFPQYCYECTNYHYYHAREFGIADWNFNYNRDFVENVHKNPKKAIDFLVSHLDELGMESPHFLKSINIYRKMIYGMNGDNV